MLFEFTPDLAGYPASLGQGAETEFVWARLEQS